MEYLIGDFSKLTNLGIKTLRFYHEIGLLEPRRVESYTGYRYYDEAALKRARTIHGLKALGFSLKEIKTILASHCEDEDLLDTVRGKLAEVDEKIDGLVQVRTRLEIFLARETLPPYEPGLVQEKILEPVMVASILFKGTYNEIGEKIERLNAALGDRIMGPPFTCYYDNQYMEQSACLEVCVPVREEGTIGGIHSRTLEGGRALIIYHVGEYGTIWRSYQAIFDAIQQRGVEYLLPSREVYLKGVGLIFKGNPQNYLTEIQYLIK